MMPMCGFESYCRYLGTKKLKVESLTELHFPGLSAKAALWLIKERKIKAIGIDTISIDYGQDTMFASHRTLTQHDVPIFENVASMQELPDTDFKVYALPMKIQNGTGAPLRIMAEID